MVRTFILTAALLGSVLAAADAIAAKAQSSPVQVASVVGSGNSGRVDLAEESLTLYVGQAHVIHERDVRRIVVGSGKVLQATALDDRQILIVPESAGQSTLHLWGKEGVARRYVVNVVGADSARVLDEIKAMLGEESRLTPRIVGDKIVVEGSDLSEEQTNRLAEVVKRYPQIVNLASRVGLERMIAVDVRMVEMRRDAVQKIGVKWNESAPGFGFSVVGDIKRSDALQPGGSAAALSGVDARARVAPFGAAFGIVSSVTSAVNLMVQNGDAVVLAEPSLSCRSGGSARFIAGGELPIPHTSGFGNLTVVFKEYGVKFDVNPRAAGSGVIAARIATEISAINFDVMVKDVPGLTKRRAETDVNLRHNETLVIAGLISQEASRTIDKVPGLGELPILGELFRSRSFRDNKTELVVFVTPRFVEPDASTAPSASERWQVPASQDRVERARKSIRMVD